jgi:hypothetical protein
VAILRDQHPELNCRVLAPRTFFGLFREFQERQGKPISGKDAHSAMPAPLGKDKPN